MPVNETNIERARFLSGKMKEHVASLREEDPSFVSEMDKLSRLNQQIDEFDRGRRQTDENGRLTAAPATRLPPSVGETKGSYNYHFEPSVSEVQQFYKNNPEAVAELTRRHPDLPRWIHGIAEPERRETYYEPTMGLPQGETVTPARSHLDMLTEKKDPYAWAADYMWEQRMEQAKKRGESIQRYKDIHLDDPPDFLAGGAEYILDRRIAPYAAGVYDAASFGLARPLYDTARDLADYELGRRGYNTDWLPPSSEEVVNRSPGSYIAGNVVGSLMPGNPSNAVQSAASRALGYEGAQAMRPVISAAVGGAQNTVEGAVQDIATAGAQGKSFGDAVETASANAPLNLAVGTVGGGLFDAAGNVIGGVREGYRGQERLQNLRVLEDAGGRTSIPYGVEPTPEIREFDRRSRQPGAVGSAGDFAAQEVSPHIQQSIRNRVQAERAKTATDTQEYFNHPHYRAITESAQPAIDSLLDMAQRGWVTGPVTGDPMNMNPPEIKKLGGILQQYTQTIKVKRGEAAETAARNGGTVISSSLANRLYGTDVAPGYDIVVVAPKINAEELTALERRIDDELAMDAVRKGGKSGNQDPVWNRYNESVKTIRDKFPLYRDEAGNLVPPPPPEPEPQPFSRDPEASSPPQEGGGVDVLPRPRSVVDRPPSIREAEPGVGPSSIQLDGPFDPRSARSQPPSNVDVLPRPRAVVDKPPDVRPQEALPGIGPGQPDIPNNPFDPSLLMPTSRARVEPQSGVDVQGDYFEPASIPREAEPGVGPQFQPERDGPVPPGPFEMPPGRVHQTGQRNAIGGEYAEPPMVEPEPQPPSTQRGTGPRRPTEELARRAPDSVPVEEATPLSLLAGNRLAMPEEQAVGGFGNSNYIDTEGAEVLSSRRGEPARGGDTEILRPNDGNTERIQPPNSEQIQSDAEWQEQQVLHAAEAYENGMKPVMDENGAVVGVQPLGDGVPDAMVMRLAKRIREKRVAEQRGALDESLPPPSPAEWRAADQEGKDFEDAVFEPGREARAADSDRVAKMAEHQQAMEEALGQVNDIDKRLGPIEPKLKEAMLLDYISRKLGREVTREDLVRAGILAGSVAVGATADEDSPLEDIATAAGALSGFGGGRRRGRGKDRTSPPGGPKNMMPPEPKPPKKRPTQPEATLDDGRKVRGFSALRRDQHTEKEAIENAERRVGATREENVHKRVINFNQIKGMKLEDDALLEEARNIGKEKELKTAAGASVYPSLKDKAWFGSGDGAFSKLADFFMLRLDPVMGAMAGHERNPFARSPSTTLEQMHREILADPARRLFQLTEGAPIAKFGDEMSEELRSEYGDPVRDYILKLYREEDDKQRKKERR